MRKKEKQKKNKDKKVPFKVVVKDSMASLKICFKHAPLACTIMLISYLLDSFVSFALGTYALKYVIDSYENGLSFQTVTNGVVLLVAIPAIVQLLVDFIVELTWSLGSNKISTSIHKSIFKKNTEVELSCYENPRVLRQICKGVLRSCR